MSLKIVRVIDTTIPFYDNNRTLPYSTLEISDDGGKTVKRVKTKEGYIGSPYIEQYFEHKGNKYPITNFGTLYNPDWRIKNE